MSMTRAALAAVEALPEGPAALTVVAGIPLREVVLVEGERGGEAG